MLIGISLGPGDPELMTFRAASVLKECTKVFVPGEMASMLAKPYCIPQILEFPMIEEKERLKKKWLENAQIVIDYADHGKTGFACIGDVNTFSTFSHLRRVIKEIRPDIEIETIPGVGIIPALASRFNIPLEGSFEVTDGSPVDTIIRMKATKPKKLIKELHDRGFQEFVLGTRLYTSQETIRRDNMPEKSDYFSVLLARRRK